MNVSQRPMRRMEKQLSREEAMRILADAEYGVLSCATMDGQPYATPVSHVVVNDALYFHCAKTGQRTDILNENLRICFTAVGNNEPVVKNETNFTTNYESVILFGEAHVVTENDEKKNALLTLCEKLLPGNRERALSSIEKAHSFTDVWRVDIAAIMGKSNMER